jgi:hypothetical protein
VTEGRLALGSGADETYMADYLISIFREELLFRLAICMRAFLNDSPILLIFDIIANAFVGLQLSPRLLVLLLWEQFLELLGAYDHMVVIFLVQRALEPLGIDVSLW